MSQITAHASRLTRLESDDVSLTPLHGLWRFVRVTLKTHVITCKKATVISLSNMRIFVRYNEIEYYP